MATSTLEVVIRGRDMLSGTLSKVSSELGGLQSKSDGLKGSILAGVGLGAGIGAFGLLTTAIQKGTDILGDAVAAAMEDERSVTRLSVSLRDNVPAWNGTTDAIEKSIAARTRLGFEDDVLRQGLGTLVARTHDVSRAMALLDSAMNLARFRGIDLNTAVDLLGKAFDGNVGALRRAGIAVDEHATAEQALATVLRSTGGQAEAYADTSMGKLEAAQVRAKESSEQLGRSLAPLVAEAASTAASGIDILVSALQGWADLINFLGGPSRDFYDQNEANRKAIDRQTAALHSQSSALDASAMHTVVGSSVTSEYTGYLHEAGDAARVAAGKIIGLGDAIHYAYVQAENFTVNAATGFKITDKQAADSADAWQRYLEGLDKSTTDLTTTRTADTAATKAQTAAEKEHADALQRTADKIAAMNAATAAYHRLPDKGSAMWDMATGAPVPGGVEYVNGKPLFRIPKTASGGGQTAHTWSATGATGGSAGMGGGASGASYDGGTGVPIVITLDGRVIAEVVDTYLVRRA